MNPFFFFFLFCRCSFFLFSWLEKKRIEKVKKQVKKVPTFINAYFEVERISSVLGFLAEDAAKTLVTFLHPLMEKLIGFWNYLSSSPPDNSKFCCSWLPSCHHHCTPLLGKNNNKQTNKQKLRWLPLFRAY